MDFDTIDKVKVLSPEAAAVVRWGIRLEGALHIIAEHPDVHGNNVAKIKKIASAAIFKEERPTPWHSNNLTDRPAGSTGRAIPGKSRRLSKRKPK